MGGPHFKSGRKYSTIYNIPEWIAAVKRRGRDKPRETWMNTQ